MRSEEELLVKLYELGEYRLGYRTEHLEDAQFDLALECVVLFRRIASWAKAND